MSEPVLRVRREKAPGLTPGTVETGVSETSLFAVERHGRLLKAVTRTALYRYTGKMLEQSRTSVFTCRGVPNKANFCTALSVYGL